MHVRMRQSAAIMVVVLALFLVGNTANAGWLDWVWPFGSQGPQAETPEAGAQTPPPGGPGPVGPGPGAPGPQPGGDQGFQPQQPPPGQFNPQNQPNQPGQPDGQFNPGMQGQPGQFNQPNQPGQPGQQPSGRFFCNSLGREATAQECDGADKARGQTGDMKPPFPGTDQQQKPEDTERMKKEQEERFRMESEQSRREVEERMKKEDVMRREQEMKKEPMPFPGQGNTEGKFPGQGATQGQFPGGKEGQRPMMNQGKQEQAQFNFDEQQNERPQFFLDPQFVKQVSREISDQTRELNRLLKAAKKLAGTEASVAKLQELLAKVEDFKAKMKSTQGEDLQSVIEDFHNEQIWDSLNGIRAAVELPKQLKEMDRSITKVEKLFKNKTIQRLSEFGVDLSKMQADVASIREKVTSVKSLLSAGSGEEAQEAMQDVWEEGFHPGEIEGTLQQLRGMTDGLRRIRNKEIQAMVKEIFQPVIDAINDGDYREANQLLNEMQYEMQRIFTQLYRLTTKSKLSTDLQSKLEAFESRIQDKLQKEAPEQQAPQEEGPGGEF